MEQFQNLTDVWLPTVAGFQVQRFRNLKTVLHRLGMAVPQFQVLPNLTNCLEFSTVSGLTAGVVSELD